MNLLHELAQSIVHRLETADGLIEKVDLGWGRVLHQRAKILVHVGERPEIFLQLFHRLLPLGLYKNEVRDDDELTGVVMTPVWFAIRVQVLVSRFDDLLVLLLGLKLVDHGLQRLGGVRVILRDVVDGGQICTAASHT